MKRDCQIKGRIAGYSAFGKPEFRSRNLSFSRLKVVETLTRFDRYLRSAMMHTFLTVAHN